MLKCSYPTSANSNQRQKPRTRFSLFVRHFDMAQVPTSGSEVSKVESDVSQTITLADSVVTLLREPVALLYQNITKVNAMKRSLGSWQADAIDEDKECRVPVLRLEEFEEYLLETDGHLLAPPSLKDPPRGGSKSPNPRETPMFTML